jgi:hypothetical protein
MGWLLISAAANAAGWCRFSHADTYTRIAKLAAWLSGKPYSLNPLICSKHRSANSRSYPLATMPSISCSPYRAIALPLRFHAAIDRRSPSA